VDRALDATTGTLRIFVSFSNPEMILKPGLFGRIRFPLEERAGALLIPQRAVQRIQDVETVLVVGADNTVALRTVTLGERIHDSFIVTSGLSPGELVVVEGLQNVLPGQRVNPLPPPGGQEQRGG
jgi:RND family efflux transporter MFP subunit